MMLGGTMNSQASHMTEDRKALTIMAHDIKAPLSAIVNLLSVIEKGYIADIAKARELVGRACQKAETLILMVDDILDYTLLANKDMMKRETINIYEVLIDSISTLKPYADERQIRLSYGPEISGEVMVNGNYTFLLRVFNNLVMNGIKYNKDQGNISIHCVEDDTANTITTKISDTGIGISKEDLGRVFNIFERGKNARKNVDGSIGLGLSLVKQIIEEHKGKINITSTLGVGSTVVVTLPRLKTGSVKDS
jgi:signal transduction histidine kinase